MGFEGAGVLISGLVVTGLILAMAKHNMDALAFQGLLV
jgi:hypothetical protein